MTERASSYIRNKVLVAGWTGGSCHADRGIGGAGAALLEVQPQGLAG